jgi:hypothetical protein
MSSVVMLNNVDHHDLRVAAGYGAAFGDAINQVLIFPTEFEAVSREYPILFRRDEEGVFRALALLGLDPDENLFLTGDDWDARYVPAIQRRGPFSIGLQRQADGTPPEVKINVDLAHPRLSAAGGEQVFLPHGGNSPYLDSVAAALATIHEGLAINDDMFEAFLSAGLIQPVALDITLPNGLRYDVPDMFSIAQDILASLDGAALERLHRPGFLALAFHAATSLGTLPDLVARKVAADG